MELLMINPVLFRNNASFGCGIVGETCDKILTTAFASGSTGLKVSLRIQAHLSRRYHLWTITVDGNAEQDPIKLKQFVLNKASTVSKELSVVVERTTLDCISCARLKLRLPWNVLLGNILRNNVCVVGDALHPMTPDLGQGVCSALEDSIVIAKCLGEALVKLIKDSGVGQEDKDENEDEDEDGEE
nr:monooxygenase 2-like isoform X3 [Nicotiana tomentosiformis]